MVTATDHSHRRKSLHFYGLNNMPQLIRCITDVAASSPIIWSRDFRPPFIVFNAFRPHQCTKCGCVGGGGGGGGGGDVHFRDCQRLYLRGFIVWQLVRSVKWRKKKRPSRTVTRRRFILWVWNSRLIDQINFSAVKYVSWNYIQKFGFIQTTFFN